MKDERQTLLELAAAWIHALTQPPISSVPFQFRGKIVLITGGSRGATHLQSLFPELTSTLTALANRFLPGPAADQLEPRTGKNSGSVFAPSVLTTLSDRAVEENNEYG